MSDMKKGDMSMDAEGIQSVVAQIEDTLKELGDIVKKFADVAHEEDQKLSGQSAPTHAMATKLQGQVNKVNKLNDIMGEIRSFLSTYQSKGAEVDDASGFNSEED